MKNKICIISSRNIFDSPCLEKYKKVLDNKFDLIYWNRAGILENSGAGESYVFNKKITPSSSRVVKIQSYYRFSLFCKKILKKQKYEKLIIFPTQTAWLIKNFLKKQYKNEYVLDIRDYAGEKKRIIHYMTKTVIENSGYVSITSSMYKTFLPSHIYHVSHNLQTIDQEVINRYRVSHIEKKNVVRISFIGSVRFFEQQKKIILLFKNDPRFHLYYIGKGSEQLEDFCNKNGVLNVTLIGFFDRKELGFYYEQTEIALNAYGYGDPFLDYALSNKIYSAAIMGMPIIVSPNTYMSYVVDKYKIGFVLNQDDKKCLDNLYQYYLSYSNETFYDNAKSFLQHVYREEAEYIESLTKFLNG